MTTKRIPQLCFDSNLSAGDSLVVYSANNDDTRRTSLTAMAAYLQTLFTVPIEKVTQYAAPSASPFTVTINPTSSPVWLILTPTGALAVGTINLPPQGTAVDKQEVLVNTTQAVTTLSVLATNSNVTGAPATLTQYQVFRMRYDLVTNTWYKV